MDKGPGKQPPQGAGGDSDPFELPRNIARQLKTCVKKHSEQAPSGQDPVKYLWINVAQRPSTGAKKGVHELTVDEWLTVVDEAATLGACCLIIFAGESFDRFDSLWRICQWAQSVHSIDVGIHTRSVSLGAAEIEQLKQLDPAHTWLFVTRQNLPKLKFLEDHGVKVRVADVGHEEQSPPCDMPGSIVFVGTEGVLYTCGLVLGNEQFRLGHVLEEPLEHILSDPTLPRCVPKGVPHPEGGCDGCPPLMAKRILADKQK